MKADTVTFQIVSETGLLYKWRTFRTDEDFYDLRRLLVVALPHMMIPPLPLKNSKNQEKKIPKRQRLY